MNIFNKRPLALILCIITGGFSLFSSSDNALKIILLIASALFVIYSFLFSKLILLRISAISLIASFIISTIYFSFVFEPNIPTANTDTVSVEGQVTDIDLSKSYVKILDVKTDKINGNNVYNKLLVYLYDTETFVPVGADVRFEAELSHFENNEDFDFHNYYTSLGYSAKAEIDSIEILSDKSFVLSYELDLFRDEICEYISSLTADYDASGFLSALLLGERERMDDTLSLDFKRMGISHILALSGMHVSILTAALLFLLKIFGIGKRKATVISILFVIAFMALVGFPASVMRAGLMLIFSSIIYLICGCKDNVTSLFAAFTIIILIEPYAALDVGLWLSVTATFGILIAIEFIGNKYDPSVGISKALKVVGMSFLASLFAIGMTMAISVVSFGNISIIAPITTFIFSILSELYIYLGLIMLIFGKLFPFIGWILKEFYGVISSLGAFFSDLPLIYPSAEPILIKILSLTITVAFILFAILDLKKRKIYVYSLSVFMGFILTLSVILSVSNTYDARVVYAADSTDKILVFESGNITFIDSSNVSTSSTNGTLRFIKENGASELDYYIINNYSSALSYGIDNLLSIIKVYTLILPVPKTQKEDEIAKKVLVVAEKHRTELSFCSSHERVTLGGISYVNVARSDFSDPLSSAFTLEYNGSLYSYISSGALKSLPESEALLYVSNTLILGSYGKDYESFVIDDVSNKLKTLIICSSGVIVDDSVYSKANVIINNSTQTIKLN